ncbi:hypothetical protein LCGC14_1828800 [marine sediment metagenome]|uniref:Uncharacterized protein n=1 Tax=marine sediment metagenome TaxID=412755 RepID=A0A0F9IW95_9ZZZZ
MEGRECECRAINLMIGLAEALDALIEEAPGRDDKLGRAAKNILRHLDNQFQTSAYTERQEPYYHLLEEMREPVKMYTYGSSGLDAEEMVRNRIHANDELKQLMACGSPYRNKESLTETARVIGEVLETFENGEVVDALLILAGQYKKLSCATA